MKDLASSSYQISGKFGWLEAKMRRNGDWALCTLGHLHLLDFVVMKICKELEEVWSAVTIVIKSIVMYFWKNWEVYEICWKSKGFKHRTLDLSKTCCTHCVSPMEMEIPEAIHTWAPALKALPILKHPGNQLVCGILIS